jgi:hypothetical protein
VISRSIITLCFCYVPHHAGAQMTGKSLLCPGVR